MKQTILLISFISIAFLLQAQNFSIGPTTGFGHSWIDHINHFSYAKFSRRFNPTWNAGFSLIYTTKKYFGLGIDIKYSAEGDKAHAPNYVSGDIESPAGTAIYYENYIRVPVKFIYFFRKNTNTVQPEIYFGPSFGFSTSLKGNFKNDAGNNPQNKSDVSHQIKNFDFGSLVGAGLNFKINRSLSLNTNIAYYQGLIDVLKDYSPAYHITGYNGNISFNGGLLYKLNY